MADGLILPAHHSERCDGFAIPHHHAWNDRVHWPLAALDAVDVIGVHAEGRSPILQHDARFWRQDPGPEARE